MDQPRIVICFPARNEETYLAEVLDSLVNQTIKPVKIIVANDGSTDRTEEIARSYDSVEVINREKREKSIVGRIGMSDVWNSSIIPAQKYDDEEPLDYILFLGGDLVLSPTYCEELHTKFLEQDDLVMAAGRMVGPDAFKYSGFMLPGGGRMAKYDYWKEIGGKYPMMQGWEAYPIYKAQVDGYKTILFDDVIYTPKRPTGGNTDYYSYGLAMRAYGYFFPFALGRSLKQLFLKSRGIKPCLNMARGYLFGKSEKYEPEIREFVNKSQKRRLRKILFRF
ncbi:MAG: glycosyltransferase family 2 protein [Candidatus Heimdallarchaeota archaeon]|nr:glycosyltransferase family 2 protein [Candidatus Heimdallarchaeota archaeon]